MTEKEFVQLQINTLQPGLQQFPDAFLDGYPSKESQIPAVRLNLGEELFGSYELIDSAGHTLHTARDIYEAKYYAYASQNRIASFPVPVQASAFQLVTVAYEKYIDSIVKKIMIDYQREFPYGKNGMAINNEVLRLLGLVRF